jgi:hypothetical protein
MPPVAAAAAAAADSTLIDHAVIMLEYVYFFTFQIIRLSKAFRRSATDMSLSKGNISALF